MLSVQQHGWWDDFVSRLAEESLFSLADEFGVNSGDLEAALVSASSPGAAVDAPWWPEVVRRVSAGESLRETARRFGTNARRLRRNLARTCVRVGGEDVREFGVEALAPFIDRIGQMPDAELAREAGVSVEAVQGERRRLGMGPFRPAPTPRCGPRMPAPRLDPETARVERVGPRVEVLEPTVVRRTLSTRSVAHPITSAPVPSTDDGGRPALPRLMAPSVMGPRVVAAPSGADATGDDAPRGRRRMVRPDTKGGRSR